MQLEWSKQESRCVLLTGSLKVIFIDSQTFYPAKILFFSAQWQYIGHLVAYSWSLSVGLLEQICFITMANLSPSTWKSAIVWLSVWELSNLVWRPFQLNSILSLLVWIIFLGKICFWKCKKTFFQLLYQWSHKWEIYFVELNLEFHSCRPLIRSPLPQFRHGGALNLFSGRVVWPRFQKCGAWFSWPYIPIPLSRSVPPPPPSLEKYKQSRCSFSHIRKGLRISSCHHVVIGTTLSSWDFHLCWD